MKSFKTIACSSDRNKVLKEIMKDEEMKKRGREATDAVKQCTTLIHRLPPRVVAPLAKESVNERAVFEAIGRFSKRSFAFPFTSLMLNRAGTQKVTALPFKPAIVIE